MITTNQTTSTTENDEEQAYAEEIGTLVFQSALMQYLAVEDNDEAKAFEAFVDENVASDSFLEDLCAEYPEFERLLLQEMSILSNELKEIIPEK